MTDEVFQKAMSIDHLWDDMLGIEEIDDCLHCFNTILIDFLNMKEAQSTCKSSTLVSDKGDLFYA